jgi:signal transduction histidine kinase/CheY-like chemotaxis protein
MSKILILSDNSQLTEDVSTLLQEIGYVIKIAYGEQDAFEIIPDFQPDIALVNTSCSDLNISTICKRLKLQGQTNDIQIILVTSEDTSSEEVMVGADGYITRPFNNNILIATINAHLRIKKLLDILYTNNSELAKSLYQLNVLYNTSSQLAGSLNKKKLIDIMSDGLEKSVSYSLCLTLIINNPEDALLIITSNYPISPRLEHALKLRGMIGYKSMFDSKTLPFELDINNIKVETHHRKEGPPIYDLEVMNFDSLFAPISTSDKFFGTVEIMRDIDLTGEDSTCFQTVVNQVALPLESALLYEEIKEKNIMLEKLEKLKSEFISIVSHELRTPLTAIKNSLDIILSGKAGEITEHADNFLNMAKRNVTRLSGIINDLLDLSKIEAGKMEYRFEPLKISEPTNFVVSTFKSLAEGKNIRLETRISDDLPLIYGDAQRIEQILSNLVSNAVKFTEENGEIIVSAKLVTDRDLSDRDFYIDSRFTKPPKLEKEYIQISVKDTGIGIKEEDIPKVFDKFQQIENSLSRKVGGTGLGISIAKQLIDAHKGYIGLESEEGHGTTFLFVLPVLNPDVDFSIELENLIQKSRYRHSNFAIIFINGENSILKEIAGDKTAIFRKSDEARLFWGENELKMIIENAGKKEVDYILEKLKNLIKNNKIAKNNVKISLGTSVFPNDATEFEELVKLAKNAQVEIY